jgi:hypothetical protein
MTQPSLVSFEVAGESYPWVTESRCRLCNSDRRLEVERLICQGRSYKAIITDLDLEGVLTDRNLREHMINRHLPVQAAAARHVAREQGEIVAEVIQPMIQGVAAHLSFAHSVVDRVRARMESGDAEPTLRDGIAAARFIAEVESVTGPNDLAEWKHAYMALLEDITEIVTTEQKAELKRRLEGRAAEKSRR